MTTQPTPAVPDNNNEVTGEVEPVAPVPPVAEPAADTAKAVLPTPPVQEVETSAELEAAKWGRIDDKGVVWVKEESGERQVGQYPDVIPAKPLQLYVRRFLDLQAQLSLFAARLPSLNPRDIDTTLSSLKEALVEPAAVGDIAGLRQQMAQLQDLATKRKEEFKAQRESEKQAALAERTKIVEDAEAISTQDPARTQWKSSGESLRQLLEHWKEAQRKGPRLDRSQEDLLWKRFSQARTTFDRNRRQFFSKLDSEQNTAKVAKEKLIEQAEALSTSTDWATTAQAYRNLMEEWKKAGRAARRDDDALWARFRAAQEKFFAARTAVNTAIDEEYTSNLAQKEAVLERAEALLPIKDAAQARNALRDLQEEWEAIGKVPRSEMSRIEKRMKAIESSIHAAEQEEWHRSNPETKARAAGLIGQLEEAISALQTELAAAQADGSAKKVKELQEALHARQAWLEQALKAAQ